MTPELKEALRGIDAQLTDITQAAQSLKGREQDLADRSKQLSGLLAELRELGQRYQALTRQIEAVLSAHESHAEALATRLSLPLNKASEQLGQSQELLKSATEKLNRVEETTSDTIGKELDKLQKQQAELTTDLLKHGTSIEQTLAATSDAWRAALKQQALTLSDGQAQIKALLDTWDNRQQANEEKLNQQVERLQKLPVESALQNMSAQYQNLKAQCTRQTYAIFGLGVLILFVLVFSFLKG